jgi:two-component sensor histidine kinase
VRDIGATEVDVAMSGNGLDHQLKERESVPVALILNELIWNAIKHARVSPQVRVRIGGLGAGEVFVEICNRGTFAEHEADGGRLCDGLGLGLIRAMMPPRGASLAIETQGDEVRATLTLSEPVVELQPYVAAA